MNRPNFDENESFEEPLGSGMISTQDQETKDDTITVTPG